MLLKTVEDFGENAMLPRLLKNVPFTFKKFNNYCELLNPCDFDILRYNCCVATCTLYGGQRISNLLVTIKAALFNDF